jgi:signal recognition particle GTPase
MVAGSHRHAVGAQAIKEETDVVVCDTSGRLHTNANLMEELSKCKRALSARGPCLLGLEYPASTPIP